MGIKFMEIIKKMLKFIKNLFCREAKPQQTVGIVVVGMEKSATYGACPGAGYDAQRMRDLLSKYSNVEYFRDNTANKVAVTDALKRASQCDLMIFFYSGHGGSQHFSDTHDEADGKDEFLCLNDGYLKDNSIWDIIKDAKGRVFLMFDCCHSETMWREVVIKEGKDSDVSVGFSMQNFSGESKRDCVKALENTPNMICWSGCADNTYSYGSITGGEFTNSLLRHFNKNLTYKDLWDKLSADAQLSKYEKIKKSTLGNNFEDSVVFK